MTNKILIIIPVRLASTRLPNKPLAQINGKTMIERVCLQAQKVKNATILVACDCKEIAQIVQKIGVESVITNPNLPSGTDRIHQAFLHFSQNNKQKFNAIINLQGDLPFISPESIEKLANLIITQDNCDIATLASIIKDKSQINNNSVVKIAIANLNLADNQKIGTALYFSRCAIPYYAKENLQHNFFHHIGIYGYKPASLEKFVNLPVSSLEIAESLEQLRALENNMKIKVEIIDECPISVDTPQDLERAINFAELSNL